MAELIEVLESIESNVSLIWMNTSSANDVTDVNKGIDELNGKMDKVIKLLERIAKATEGTWNEADRSNP